MVYRKFSVSNYFNSILLVISIFLLFGLSYTDLSNVFAQQPLSPPLTERLNHTNDTRSFEITFDTITINEDHDPLFGGEWVMNAYVNNRIIDLFPESRTVNNGDTINFTGVNSANFTIPNNNLAFLRIATIGWENDVGFEPIPVFFALLDIRIPFYVYTGLVQQATEPFILGPNDPNGFVAIQYDKDENFGVGSHSICSDRNVAATDPNAWYEGNCDYRINFTIEEIK